MTSTMPLSCSNSAIKSRHQAFANSRGLHRFSATAAAAAASGRPPSAPYPATTVDLASFIVHDGGPPRLCSPLPTSPSTPTTTAAAASRPLHTSPPPPPRATLPLMLYLPGIDGTGLAAAQQFPSLLRRFDLVTLITPPEDRTDFSSLVEAVVSFLQAEVPRHPPERPVYLLGESFGGILALAIAVECPGLVDRLVLVNPATSFADTIWPTVGQFITQAPAETYRALPFALAPVLGNPINLLAASLDGTSDDDGPAERLSAIVAGAARLLRQLPLLAEILPADTLAWKLKLLEEGCAAVAPRLKDVSQRVLVIVGDQDALIPSREEGPRLLRMLPRAHLRVERGRSHALLQEGGVDLVRLLEEEGAMVTSRRLSAAATRRSATATAGFGTAEPIELPTAKELERIGGRTTALGRRLASPIFLSTSEEGNVDLGINNVPIAGPGRPVLFVGNHQSLALDLGVLVEEFMKQQGVLMRGLAHPVIFADALRQNEQNETQGLAGSEAMGSRKQRGGRGSSSPAADLSPFDVIPTFGALLRNVSSGARNGGGGGSASGSNEDGRRAFGDFMIEFGAVPVSGKNLVRLMQNGESVLLFPGGVREAYKRKGEEYRLFWPSRPEFVRAAAKYGAIIVPFAAIGVDDSLDILLDGNELKNAPFIGQAVSQRASALPQARKGVSADRNDVDHESFIAPLAFPKLPPKRMYFMFRKPIRPQPELIGDRDRCERVYEEVKGEVEAGLKYLLQRRNEDPYADFGKRVIWEAARGGKVQAPTFPLR